MQIDKNSQEFCQTTNSYDLIVSLEKNKLKIRLKDLIDWTIFEKEYSEDDIGLKEIHKKVDLLDIFNALAYCESKHEGPLHSKGKIPVYNFGDIVKNGENDCYKIQRNGRITVFMKLRAINSNRLTECNSNLVLTKICKMTDNEISRYKGRSHKEEISGENEKEIKLLRVQNKLLYEKVQNLEKQVKSLNKIIQQFKGINLEKAEEKPKKEAIKIKNGKYRIQSMYGTNLRGNLFWIVDLTHNSDKWQEWTVQEKNGYYQLRSWWNDYLSGTPEGKVGAEKKLGSWEQWEIIPKVNSFYIKSSRGTYLTANQKGHVKLSEKAGPEQEWKLIS